MTKEIPLTQGKVALVDDDDFEELNKFKWQAVKRPNGRFYATRSQWIDGKPTEIKMHRVINKTPYGMDTDHVNRNGLDNRKENLRTATHSQNVMNTEKRIGKFSSRYKGVSRHGLKWQARLDTKQKSFYLGSFETEQEAATAYDRKVKELFGDYTYTNQVEPK